MKKALLVSFVCSLLSFVAPAQVTFLADTAMTTDIGYGGAPASCIYKPGGYWFGREIDYTHGWWLADDFVVPSGATWAFDTVILYAYQKGSGTTSPFTGAYLRIYKDGPPGLGGVLAWGDSVTNILSSTSFTGIYRVDTATVEGGLMSTERPIMELKLYLATPPILSAGTYWLAWSTTASGAIYMDSPPKVLPGRVNPASQNGRFDSSGFWGLALDAGHALGFNKIIKASAAVAELAVPAVRQATGNLLEQNVPNPFSATTSVSFYLSQACDAKLLMYNSIGQLVATLADGRMSAGSHQVTVNAGNLPQGLYYYRLVSFAGVESRTMLLVK